jgi:hypothetical protein
MSSSSSRVVFASLALCFSTAFVPLKGLAAPFSLEQATVPTIISAFDSGELTSAKLVQFYRSWIAAYDTPSGLILNAIISLNPNVLVQAAALDAERKATGPRSLLCRFGSGHGGQSGHDRHWDGSVPASTPPLALAGAAMAWRSSRQLRRRLRAAVA